MELFFTHSGTRTVRQIEGVSTLILADNVYEIVAGTHTVNRPNGSSLTATVQNPFDQKNLIATTFHKEY